MVAIIMYAFPLIPTSELISLLQYLIGVDLIQVVGPHDKIENSKRRHFRKNSIFKFVEKNNVESFF